VNEGIRREIMNKIDFHFAVMECKTKKMCVCVCGVGGGVWVDRNAQTKI